MTEVRIPKMGMSTVEVDIVELNVGVGASVEPGTALVAVESEKASFTIESEVAGVVAEILVEEGDVRNVGDVLLRIEERGG